MKRTRYGNRGSSLSSHQPVVSAELGTTRGYRLAFTRQGLILTVYKVATKIEPFSNDTASHETFSKIQHWIDECDESHAQCGISQSFSTTLPRRLIAIDQSSRSISLVDFEEPSTGQADTKDPSAQNKNKSVRYLALSYRWGATASHDGQSPPTPIMLTAKTEAMLKNGCQISRLPRTIRDACAVAVRLGFRYLWVDRLCIMQDSAEDWDREAGRMALVYKNAALTISASAASGEDAGFFRRRRRGVQPLWLSVDTRRSANSSASTKCG